MNNRWLAAGAAAVMLSSAVESVIAEAAYEEPSDILITAGSAELGKDDMNGDTVVEIPVYISNNPGFTWMDLIFTIDDRLRFDSEKEIAFDDHKIAGVYMVRCDESGKSIYASLDVSDEMENGRFTENAEICRLRIIVPGNTPGGSYPVEIKKNLRHYEASIYTYDHEDAMFGTECFSEPVSGSIKVNKPIVTEPPHQDPPPPEQNTPGQGGQSVRQGGNSNTSRNESSNASETQNDTENKAVTTQAATKATTSEKVTVTTALTSKKTETATTVSTTKKADETSASVSETTDDTGRKQTAVKGNILLPVICGAILFLVAAVGLASRKRR